MPQLDFRRVFSASTQDNSGVTEASPGNRSKSGRAQTAIADFLKECTGFSRSQLVNIAFVACACLGAVICALYVFNTNELIQAASGWPGEFLYRRPDLVLEHGRNPHGIAQRSASESNPQKPASDSGDPFPHRGPFLTYNQPSLLPPRTTTGPSLPSPSASSLLNQLGLPAPGGDALTRTLNQGAANLAQSKVQGVQGTTTAMKNVRARVTTAATTQSRNTPTAPRKSAAQLDRKAAHAAKPSNPLSNTPNSVPAAHPASLNAGPLNGGAQLGGGLRPGSGIGIGGGASAIGNAVRGR